MSKLNQTSDKVQTVIELSYLKKGSTHNLPLQNKQIEIILHLIQHSNTLNT